MVERIEFYQRLREHIPEEAARLIAEEVPVQRDLATLADLNQATEKLELKLDNKIERLRSDLFRWNLTFFVPLWIGVYATLVTLLIRG